MRLLPPATSRVASVLSPALGLLFALSGCGSPGSGPGASGGASTSVRALATEAAPAPGPSEDVAIFAGGCFWCEETAFEGVPGVLSVLSGYTGGHVDGPSYDEVCEGDTGHAEAVYVRFDPARVTYAQLLDVFWHNVDPTQRGGQFCDRGTQYRSAVFPRGAAQRAAAEESRARVAQLLPGEIVTEVTDAQVFWVAEAYHQDFYRTHPTRYAEYRLGCGRDARLRAVWGDLAGH